MDHVAEGAETVTKIANARKLMTLVELSPTPTVKMRFTDFDAAHRQLNHPRYGSGTLGGNEQVLNNEDISQDPLTPEEATMRRPPITDEERRLLEMACMNRTHLMWRNATGNTKIAFTVLSKSPGSMSQERYEKYSKARCLAEALQYGATPQDITYDLKSGTMTMAVGDTIDVDDPRYKVPLTAKMIKAFTDDHRRGRAMDGKPILPATIDSTVQIDSSDSDTGQQDHSSSKSEIDTDVDNAGQDGRPRRDPRNTRTTRSAKALAMPGYESQKSFFPVPNVDVRQVNAITATCCWSDTSESDDECEVISNGPQLTVEKAFSETYETIQNILDNAPQKVKLHATKRGSTDADKLSRSNITTFDARDPDPTLTHTREVHDDIQLVDEHDSDTEDPGVGKIETVYLSDTETNSCLLYTSPSPRDS